MIVYMIAKNVIQAKKRWFSMGRIHPEILNIIKIDNTPGARLDRIFNNHAVYGNEVRRVRNYSKKLKFNPLVLHKGYNLYRITYR